VPANCALCESRQSGFHIYIQLAGLANVLPKFGHYRATVTDDDDPANRPARGEIIMLEILYAKTTVSTDAVIKRANRRMKTLGITLKAVPPGSRRERFGQFCVVGPQGFVTEKHVDLAQMARELGVLGGDEEIS